MRPSDRRAGGTTCVLRRALAAVLALTASCAGLHTVPLRRVDVKVGAFTRHYDGSYFQVGEGGAYSVELVTTAERLRAGARRFDIVVHDAADVDVENGIVTAAARTAEGPEAALAVVEQYGGIYTLAGLPDTGGRDWDLTVRVQRRGGPEDRVLFHLPGTAAPR